jgi:hypothetical protein
MAILFVSTVAFAGENGGQAFPVGVETVFTALKTPPGQTTVNYYFAYYDAGEFDDAHGKSMIPNYRFTLLANAIKMNHGWNINVPHGNLYSEVAVPMIRYHLELPGNQQGTNFGLNNVDIIPIGVYQHAGIAHWYYEADVMTPGSGYSKNNLINVGQHYWSAGPVAGFTLLPNQGKTEIDARFSFYMNHTDGDTNYHSGNEFFVEYSVNQSITKKVTVGLGGVFFQQVQDDTLNGAVYMDGFRGRVLKIGPQVRFPLGKHGAFAVKYFCDTLVQNKPRGNTFWFQLGVPLPGLSSKPKS